MNASLLRLGHPRVGFVVPKHGKSSVERNLLKRRLRELARTVLLPRMASIDMVIHARPSAYRLTFDELARIAATIDEQAARIAAKLVAVD